MYSKPPCVIRLSLTVALTITHGNTQNTGDTEIKQKKKDKERKGKSSKILCFNISYDLFFTYIIYKFVLDMDIAQYSEQLTMIHCKHK
jgi:hypothetical protein